MLKSSHQVGPTPKVGDFIIQTVGPTTHEAQLERDSRSISRNMWNVPWYKDAYPTRSGPSGQYVFECGTPILSVFGPVRDVKDSPEHGRLQVQVPVPQFRRQVYQPFREVFDSKYKGQFMWLTMRETWTRHSRDDNGKETTEEAVWMWFQVCQADTVGWN